MPSVTINIFGEEYTLKSSDDPEYVRKVAALVDRNMREVAASSKFVSPSKIAILAALNIADEYFRLLDKTEADRATVDRVVQGLVTLLDGALKP